MTTSSRSGSENNPLQCSQCITEWTRPNLLPVYRYCRLWKTTAVTIHDNIPDLQMVPSENQWILCDIIMILSFIINSYKHHHSVLFIVIINFGHFTLKLSTICDCFTDCRYIQMKSIRDRSYSKNWWKLQIYAEWFYWGNRDDLDLLRLSKTEKIF